MAPKDVLHSSLLPHCECGNKAGRAGLVLISASGLRAYVENNSTLAFDPCLWARPCANCLTWIISFNPHNLGSRETILILIFLKRGVQGSERGAQGDTARKGVERRQWSKMLIWATLKVRAGLINLFAPTAAPHARTADSARMTRALLSTSPAAVWRASWVPAVRSMSTTV